MKQLIFVSSVQKELADERKAIRDFVQGNRLLGKHFDVFIFEDLPAKSRRPDDLYLDKVEACSVFIAMFAVEYGWEDPQDGLSPTEREFQRATELGRPRLLFLKNNDKDTKPHPKMAALINRAKAELIYKRFNSAADLTSLLYDSLIEYLEDLGIIQSKPFDAAPCRGADLGDIADARIKWFLPIARRERNLNLPASASKQETLTHLKMADGDGVTNAAILLFGADPQKHAPAAVTKCAHYHGTEVAKPIPSHQVFEGTLFEQVDEAVDFVMSKLARSLGRHTRRQRRRARQIRNAEGSDSRNHRQRGRSPRLHIKRCGPGLGLRGPRRGVESRQPPARPAPRRLGQAPFIRAGQSPDRPTALSRPLHRKPGHRHTRRDPPLPRIGPALAPVRATRQPVRCDAVARLAHD